MRHNLICTGLRCRHVHAPNVWFHAGASCVCLRSPPARGEHRAAGALPLVPTSLRAPPQKRERLKGESCSRLPPGQLPRALQDPGEPPVLTSQPPEVAAALAQGALHRGGEAAGPPARGRGEVPRPEKVSPAPLHLGRRGDELLLQGEEPERPAGVVHPQPVSVPEGKERAGRGHGTHHHTGQQLVQEPAAERPSGGGEREVGAWILKMTIQTHYIYIKEKVKSC